MSSPKTSRHTYLWVYIALMLLLAVSYLAARMDLGRFNTGVGLVIAAIKATLVALFFMNLRHQKGMVRVAAIAGIFWLGVLISLVLSDIRSRDWLPLPGPWPVTGITATRK